MYNIETETEELFFFFTLYSAYSEGEDKGCCQKWLLEVYEKYRDRFDFKDNFTASSFQRELGKVRTENEMIIDSLKIHCGC